MTHHPTLKPIIRISALVLLLILGSVAQAQQVNAPGDFFTEWHNGSITNDAPFVEDTLTVTQEGSTIVLDIVSVTGDLDSKLYLLDERGTILAENDDRPGADIGDFSSYIEYPQAAAGDYRIITTRFGVLDGTSTGDFELRVDVMPRTERPAYNINPDALRAAGFPLTMPNPRADWTILAYYGGDTNLEAALLKDLDEFELAGGSTGDVRIIVMMDRHPEYTTAGGNWASARLFEVSADLTGDHDTANPPTIDTEPLADLGTLDMGLGETFAQFLAWGVQQYPAERYAIALGSHGGGWRGLITDETAGETILSLGELQQGFEIARDMAGVDRFDIIINDACSMGSAEYNAMLQPYFRYSLASPEIVVDPATDMSVFASILKDEENVDLVTVSQRLIDQYMQVDVQRRPGNEVVFLTNSLTDLDAMPALVDEINAFAALVKEDPVLYRGIIGEARANSYTYSHFIGDDTRIDLASFMRNIRALAQDTPLRDAANNVLTALENSIIYAQGGAAVADRIGYVSIYFPQDGSDFSSSYFDDTTTPQWGRMLQAYYNAVSPQVWTVDKSTAFHLPVAPKINVVNVYPTENVSTLTSMFMEFEVVAAQIAGLRVTLEQPRNDGSFQRVMQTNFQVATADIFQGGARQASAVESLISYWDGVLPQVSDGDNAYNELLFFTDEASGSIVTLHGRVREPGSDIWNDVAVIFDESGSVRSIVNETAETGAMAVIDISPGATFESKQLVISDDGSAKWSPNHTYTWPEGGLTWQMQPAPSGTYQIGLEVEALGGTVNAASVPITIDNEGIDPEWRSFIHVDTEFSLPYPQTWSLPQFTFEDGAFQHLRTTSPDGQSQYSMYLGGTSDPADLVQVANTVFGQFDMLADGRFAQTTIDDMPALEFDYAYETENRTMQGRAFALFSDWNGGIVMAAETTQGDDVLAQLYDDLKARVSFYNPLELYADAPYIWDFSNLLDDDTRLPYPQGWTNTPVNGWERYSLNGDTNSATFFADYKTNVSGVIDVASLRDEMLQDNVLQNDAYSDVEVVGTRTYYSRNHKWQAALYTAQRDGMTVSGRMYSTQVGSRAYTLWMETPLNDETTTIYQTILEPMVDSYAVVNPQR